MPCLQVILMIACSLYASNTFVLFTVAHSSADNLEYLMTCAEVFQPIVSNYCERSFFLYDKRDNVLNIACELGFLATSSKHGRRVAQQVRENCNSRHFGCQGAANVVVV